MNKLTSNFTIFWKLFFPTLCITLLYLFGLILVFAENENFDIFYDTPAKVAYWVFILIVFVLFYFTIMSLKRVEFDEEYFYITNYFKTVKVHKSGIEKIVIPSINLFGGRVYFNHKGTFGTKVSFVPDRVGVRELKAMHPELIGK